MEVKDSEKDGEHKSVKVACNFCGGEMECPEDMIAESEKHMCFACFNQRKYPKKRLKNVHVDIPLEQLHESLSGDIAEALAEETFQELWSERKEELKMNSKRELAEEMFYAGASFGVHVIFEMMKHTEKKFGKKDNGAGDDADSARC